MPDLLKVNAMGNSDFIPGNSNLYLFTFLISGNTSLQNICSFVPLNGFLKFYHKIKVTPHSHSAPVHLVLGLQDAQA